MADETHYTSFLIRIWRDNPTGEAQGEPACRGEVHHIQSDCTHHFSDMAALLCYLDDQTQACAVCPNSKPQEA